MTALAEHKVSLEAMGHEVRFGERGRVVAYVLGGPGAASLEQALAENGFSLVPMQSRAASDNRTDVAA